VSRHYGQIAFTEDVRAAQERNGSGSHVAPAGGAAAVRPVADRLGPAERAFLAERDGFYLASVGATGWPYVQYRGGSSGVLRVLDDVTLGWADFGGNLQYVSTGNVAGDDRVALIVMDYAGQRRLKVYGRARVQDASGAPELVRALADAAGPNVVERVVTVAVAAYDWNCPRHIVRRFTARELQPQVLRLVSEVEALQEENRGLREQLRLAVAAGGGES
jgi:predicted pyridoxine 5'-phosphate oxidase superfamily flavin-nucleotide-binding protein